MASNSYFQLILFLSFFCNCSLKTSSEITDFDKWLSWNVQNHRSKQALGKADQSLNIQSPAGTGSGGRVLDDKLRIAEANKVRINVSQDGTGDFRTIKGALNSIPLRNTRRVILVIKPGTYRYTSTN